ncbi:alpha/beta hydrolase [Pseudidiomarina andamanensis]|uniref:Carboxylesterase n=1 Tax=Pseudidiomarina andamanensis TaxID=1940690 RepID=A0AA92ETV7_9GAMM|nr:dienelactone hydrolase family protein [Pseudidiomarina andamanensis]MDS0218980.1 alpha/beta hydrolase [Pseudidiomarina andamanensis]QGT96338.1 carboxylesterase [Pseudidiomarina andamanensis]
MSYLPCVEIEPQPPATHAIIWLHGLGADGNDFAPLVPHLTPPVAVRFIFPHAPQIPVTINGGMRMPAWYDILSMSLGREVDEQQLRDSAAAVHQLIEREIERGIPAENILLAGFSQGGAVAYEAALTYPKHLRGLLALSTYLATHQSITPHAANNDIPILVQHGSQDPVVPEALGQHAYQWLKQHGYNAEYQTFTMQHQVCGEQVQAINAWLQKVLA